MQNYIWPLLLPLLFLAYSLPLFLRVYATTETVIDEEFHLRQGLHFCNKRFDVWDPKITTFPGLYLFSLVLQPLGLCSVLGLRLISLFAAVVNVVLLYRIRRRTLGGANSTLAALEAFTMASLPPLYFFSHLYYTDTLALTSVLFFYHFWLKESHLQAAVCGRKSLVITCFYILALLILPTAAASVLVRQTNIVWLGMFFGITALDELTKQYAKSKCIKSQQVQLFNWRTWLGMLTSMDVLLCSLWHILRKCCFYLLILLPFVAFVFLNGSIVVGDKRAHEATIHLPQLFYFSLFTLIFGISNTLLKLRSTLLALLREKLIVLFLLGLCVLVVKWNTLVHPYLLADNRHYIFYIWNRLYGRYAWFKYAITPVYVVALALLYAGLRHMRDSFKLMFAVALMLVLCFQRLLEVRYFLIPFILFRLNTLPLAKSRATQWLELSCYVALNALTFYVFFTKEIKWQNYSEPQRIIW